MRTVLVLAIILTACMCSAPNLETQGLEEEAEKGELSCCAGEKTSISTSDQQSQTDEDQEQFYNDEMGQFMKGEGYKLKGVMKRAEEKRSNNPEVIFLLPALRQGKSLTEQGKAFARSCLCEILGLGEGASENEIIQVFSEAMNSAAFFARFFARQHDSMSLDLLVHIQEITNIMLELYQALKLSRGLGPEKNVFIFVGIGTAAVKHGSPKSKGFLSRFFSGCPCICGCV
jgi:hypothetical protein